VYPLLGWKKLLLTRISHEEHQNNGKNKTILLRSRGVFSPGVSSPWFSSVLQRGMLTPSAFHLRWMRFPPLQNRRKSKVLQRCSKKLPAPSLLILHLGISSLVSQTVIVQNKRKAFDVLHEKSKLMAFYIPLGWGALLSITILLPLMFYL
jgi:hypothetical protein